MSDKETARKIHNWMLGGVHAEIASCHTCDQIAELLAAECTAPAPQPTKEEAEIAVDKMFNTWLSRHCFFYANKTLRASGWREIAISLYRRAATPQVTPELEIEQESDGRWIAEFMRFPGVAAYGPSREEAIRNAAKVLIESEPASPDPFSKGYKHREGKPVSDACGEGRHAECTQDLTKCHCTFRTGHTVLHAYVNPKLASEQASPTPLEEMCDSAIDLAAALRVSLKELARQVEISNAVDDHGHPLRNLKALHDAKKLLEGTSEQAPQVTPTPLTPEEIADACSQTRTFGWLTDNGYPTSGMSQKEGFTKFQLAPILEAYWNWRKVSLDPKGD